MDPRITKWAKLLVHYSLKLKKGDLFMIRGEHVAMPLMTAVFREALAVGAHPFLAIDDAETHRLLMAEGSKQQLKYVSPITKYQYGKADKILTVWGGVNTRYLAGVDPVNQQLRSVATTPVLNTLFRRMGNGSLHWCGTMFPTQAEAQDANMSLAEWEKYIFSLGHLNARDPIAYWTKFSKEQARLVKILNRVDRLTLRAPGTDLSMSVKGRTWVNCDGQINFPDGEIFTGPIEDTAEGEITFSFPSIAMGREVEGIRLVFKNGVVTEATADKNEAFLRKMLKTDPGASRIGEIAIGTNFEVDRVTKQILFDEKRGGSCHLAVGKSIPESGGKNKSGIHWDMICDMAKGEILADGKVIYRNRKFLI